MSLAKVFRPTNLVIAAVFTAVGMGLAKTDLGSNVANAVSEKAVAVKQSALETVVASSDNLGARELVLLEYPSLLKRIMKGGAFGGDFSKAVAEDMFGQHNHEAIEDARDITEIVEVAPRTWMIYMPIVNAILLETDEGLVLIDTGMAPAGPAIMEAIRSVSDKPLHTIIYTHGHVDHAYGTWALMEDNPRVVAHEELVNRFDRYIRLRGSLAKSMTQQEASMPASKDDLVYPTQVFRDELVLTIGGEDFVLRHHRGETDDQLYVWIPSRKAIASADYYQGFLPNAGNGKRYQRYPEEWADALREMADWNPELLLPAHGKFISNPAEIKENFTVLADTLQYIVDHTIAELNKGTRKGLIPHTLTLPEQLADHPTMNVQYVSPADISKMVIKRYTGWWDEIPSHWTPALFEARSQEIAQLAGGIDRLVARAREVAKTDIVMASHLTDWAWYGHPQNPAVQALVIEVYKQRIEDERSNTMEMLAYLELMTEARQRQLDAKAVAVH
ncbi:MAG: MBL fold metallo-hydrolase [Cellvibrionaceae bacterium]|nr:MBL fold metallo-hydrolase [Cellvibrionaceae bacterium]